jgi:hypothetical protein
VRGAVLLAVAVVLGALLLAYGFPDGGDSGTATAGEQVTGEAGQSTGDGGDGSPPTVAPPTTTDTGPRDPAEITVLVANGSGVSGAASEFTDTLNGAGYVTAEAANADQSDYSTTVVYYVGEEQAEAEGVATALGLDPSAVEPMPDPPPTEDGDLRGATVLVVVGTDLAS